MKLSPYLPPTSPILLLTTITLRLKVVVDIHIVVGSSVVLVVVIGRVVLVVKFVRWRQRVLRLGIITGFELNSTSELRPESIGKNDGAPTLMLR